MHCPIKEKRVKGSFREWINGDYIKLVKTGITTFQELTNSIMKMIGREQDN